jgi:hypothetical protein
MPSTLEADLWGATLTGGKLAREFTTDLSTESRH